MVVDCGQGGGGAELWVLIMVVVAVGGQEKERIKAIGLQRFVGFKFFVFIFLLFGCGFVLQMSC